MIQYRTLNCNGKLISLETPAVMGIVNINLDSFYKESRAIYETEVLTKIDHMSQCGAAFIDLGAMSSSPGSSVISSEEEWRRLSPVISAARKNFPELLFSVDTIHSATAARVLDLGVDIINDISGGIYDPEMMKTVGQYDVPFIVMHMQGMPANMQQKPLYENVVTEIFDYFVERISEAEDKGIVDIILDPGFGFGKTLAHNYELLQNLHAFEILRFPVLVGVSRKGMIKKVLHVDTENALNGTTAVHILALLRGARILRVHDVAEAVQCIKIWDKFKNPNDDISDFTSYIIE